MSDHPDWKDYVGQPLRSRMFVLPERSHFAYGNGFVLAPRSQFVLTAAHVVNGASAIRVLARASNNDIVRLVGVKLKMILWRDLAAIQLPAPISSVDPLTVGEPEGKMSIELGAFRSYGRWATSDMNTRSALAEPTAHKLIYDRNLGVPGESGAAIVIRGTNRVVGIHVGEPGFTLSHATLCSQAIIDDLIS